jgi:hypothetical protein
MACVVMAFFCFKNNHELSLPAEEFYRLAKRVSESDPNMKDEVVKLIASVIKNLQR